MRGKVYLVGAGPGDPELLTLRALRVLHSADAVLHDDLVAPEILKLIPPSAQRHNVGKRCGKKKITQVEINFLMVTLADFGLQVVRLKSGDPLIFGRLGEEIEALRRNGVEFEVIPGVTSVFGAAASLQVPLTERRFTPALVLLSGHRAAENEDTDWRKFVASGATLVIYMPGQNYGEIATRLRKSGVAVHTPCAIVSRASTQQQQTHLTTVREMPRAPQLPSPTLLIVGDVVRFAETAESQPGMAPNYEAGDPRPIDLDMLFSQATRLAHKEEPRA